MTCKLAVLTLLASLIGYVACQGGCYGYYPSPSPSRPASGLTVGYYDYTCHHAEEIVRGVAKKAVEQNPGIGAGLTRMLFPGCFVQGCDASVLLDATAANSQPEKLAAPNFPSLRGFEVIDAAKAALEAACPGNVSCADIVAFAARDATFFLSDNRVDFKMPAGRRDRRVSLGSEVFQFLPPPSFNLTELIDSFAVKELDLSGAHTVGRSHCSSFTDRLTSSDSDMNPALAASLRRKCPANPTPSNDPTVVQDVVTPSTLGSQYYRNVLNHSVLFTSDASLLTSVQTKVAVLTNAFAPGLWEERFKFAMVKMAAVEIKTGADGEIRRNCRVVN